MEFKTYLQKIIDRQDLSEAEMRGIIAAALGGELTVAQMGAFLSAMACKGVVFAELAGAAQAMRAQAERLQLLKEPLVDVVGTGGDSLNTFNVSTTSAIVVAGAGCAVAKHGNRGVSSKCGSADVLEALGVKINVAPELMEEAINEVGLGFCFAQRFHPAMRHAAPVRAELGVRTLFNLLGPLTNPAGAGHMLIGVYAKEIAELYTGALQLLGIKKALVVHGGDGMDEITVTAPTMVSELTGETIKTYELLPEDYIEERYDLAELAGGEPAANARIVADILHGKLAGAKRAIVLLNSGAALYAAGQAESIEEGVAQAAESIDSGAAWGKLQGLKNYLLENSGE